MKEILRMLLGLSILALGLGLCILLSMGPPWLLLIPIVLGLLSIAYIIGYVIYG